MKRLLAPALGLAMLGACSTATPSVTPAQVAADLTGVLTTLQQMEPAVVKADPTAFTPQQIAAMTNDLANAQKILAGFTAGMPAASGATEAQEIDGYLNDALNTLAAVAPLVPVLAPWSDAIDAIDAVLPTVETFVNANLPKATTTIAGIPVPTVALARGKRVARLAMTPDQGREFLGIPIVHP
jgi:hypothetical protein